MIPNKLTNKMQQQFHKFITWHYNRPDHDQQHCYHHAPTVKPEAANAVVVAPDDGQGSARNMLSHT
jgi:hypothetical protein